MFVCAKLTKLKAEKILTQIRIQIQNAFRYVICVVILNEAHVMLFVTRYHTFSLVNN